MTESFAGTADANIFGIREMLRFGMELLRLGLHGNALECFENVAIIFQHKQAPFNDNFGDFFAHDATSIFNRYLMGTCLTLVCKEEEALHTIAKCMRLVSKVFPPKSLEAEFWKGRCLLQLRKPKKAIEHLKKALELKEGLLSTGNCDNELLCYLYWVGICFMEMGNAEGALEKLGRAREIIKPNLSDSQGNDIELANLHRDDIQLANILFACGKCLYLQNKLNDATESLRESLEIRLIRQDEKPSKLMHGEIAETKLWIGKCLKGKKEFGEAIVNLKDALSKQKSLTLDEGNAIDIAVTQYELGYCQLYAKKGNDVFGALDNLRNALRITENVSSDIYSDAEVLKVLKLYCDCLIKAKSPKALENCKRLLQMQEKRSPNIELDKDIFETLDLICRCLIDFKRPCESRSASKYLQRELRYGMYQYDGKLPCCIKIDTETALFCTNSTCTIRSISCCRSFLYRSKQNVSVSARTCLGPCFNLLSFCLFISISSIVAFVVFIIIIAT